MLEIRPSHERGGGDYGWLKTQHTFSFDQYHDPRWMGSRSLRVINEDFVVPGAVFPTHPHRDMEIITYVLEGALAMSAGTGVRHSEANPSPKNPVHWLQIWILPDRNGHSPGYEQKSFPEAEKRGRFRLMASPNGADGSVTIHQDAKLYVSLLSPGQQVQHDLAAGRFGWLQIAKGTVELNGKVLKQGDGAATDEQRLMIKASEESELLLFDLT